MARKLDTYRQKRGPDRPRHRRHRRRDGDPRRRPGDAATLVYLANQACITLHGWASLADRLDRPDRLLIDLDPAGATPVALGAARRKLDAALAEVA